MNITFDYDDAPTLLDFAQSDARIRGIRGPLGSGKSSACTIEIAQRGMAMPRMQDGVRRSRYAVIRNTFTELRDTTIRTVHQWMPPQYFGKFVESKHSYMIKGLAPATEIEVLYLALDRPEDISKLLSLELTGAWINEAREVPWAIVEALQGRIGRFPPVSNSGPYWHGIWMDTNPPDSDSAWYRFFEKQAWLPSFQQAQREGKMGPSMRPEEYAAQFVQPSGASDEAENLRNLKQGYYNELAIGKAKEWVKIYIEGDYGFIAEGKLVYPEYSDRIHCQAVDPVAGSPIIRSYDWGLTPACALSQMLPDGRWLVFDEIVSENMSADEFIQNVNEHCNKAFNGQVTFEDYGDPAGSQRAQTDKRTCFDIAEAQGIKIEPSIQDPKLRQEAVRKTLRTLVNGEPQFILHPRCQVLRKGFLGGYKRRRLQVPGVERYSEQPDKTIHSHVHDALQYGMVQYFAPALTNAPREDDYPDFGSGYDYAAEASRSEYTGY